MMEVFEAVEKVGTQVLVKVEGGDGTWILPHAFNQYFEGRTRRQCRFRGKKNQESRPNTQNGNLILIDDVTRRV